MIDRQFYIDMARKRINDFMGIKPEKKGRTKTMAEKKIPNVFAKINEARRQFLEARVNQTGKNMKLQFMYYELEDIVPVAERIFDAVGLSHIMTFTDQLVTMTVVNVEDPNDIAQFTLPFREPSLIQSSKTGGNVTNELQALGSAVTYIRRYMFQVVLDICIPDETEPNLEDKTPAPITAPAPVIPAPAPKEIPISTEKREEVKEKLTDADGKADALQIDSLKAALRKLIEKNEAEGKKYGAELALQTKSFKEISKVQWEAAMSKINAMMEA